MSDFSSITTRLPLLLILLLAPGVGLAAQEPATEEQPPLAASEQPGTQEHAPLRLSEEPWAQADDASRLSPGWRLVTEAGVGVLLGLGGGYAGIVTSQAMCDADLLGFQGGFMPCLGPNLIGVLLGVGIGIPLGVWSSGQLMGGDGNLMGALAGSLLGLLPGILVAMFVPHTLGLPLAFSFPLMGAMVGYELTRPERAPGPQAPAMASAPRRLQPVLAFSSRGALVGLGGSF
ncbi:hypothetical protein ACN28E_50685 [Archangium lansingense]|uniref:hypothetical protein n=1 Tax=Archangium lansingense TaxID=2995310 RepID=UPI003B7BAD22